MEQTYRVGVYCRLSKNDDNPGESTSIETQRSIVLDYCAEHNFQVFDVYVDDGATGLNFEREGFQRLLADVESGKINMVITKDLSRLGRDYIMTGYYSEIYFPSRNVRYIAIANNFDSEKENNDIAPFMNILNDMYARDISRKIKAAKLQRAKSGVFIGSQVPYGYINNKGTLIVDQDTAPVVQKIFVLAASGWGEKRIADELEQQRILCPAAYKKLHGDTRFTRFLDDNLYRWKTTTIRQMLTNRVYLGELCCHKTEVINYKTKQRRSVPEEEQIRHIDAHEAIISAEQFSAVQTVVRTHLVPHNQMRENMFRGLLYCSCCGHPLSIAHRKLLYREENLYRCMHHYYNRKECPRTHSIYHDVLYKFVKSEIVSLAKSMRRRHVSSQISELTSLDELTPEILHAVISKIEIDHVPRKVIPRRVIHITWKL